jgi:hypothetical protein
LRYLRLHETGNAPPASLVLVSFAASLIKLGTFLAAVVVAGFAFLLGSLELAGLGESTGWRGSVALLVALAILVAIGAAIGAIVVQRLAALGRERTAAAAAQS